jgi:valyl-tRNA synthetase
MNSLPKRFDPAAVESALYQQWEAAGVGRANPDSGKPAFAISMPPPNVTGSLHMGHALQYTLPDILCRFKRATGFDVLWQPGVDHAGIAAHLVVEKQLAAAGKHRFEVGRAAFDDKMWELMQESGGIHRDPATKAINPRGVGRITTQMRRLGILPDWSRQRFTMDDGLSALVRQVFVKLFDAGLIYRAKRLVNWDPTMQTAVSDVEVEQKTVAGQLSHIRYDGDGFSITVATTRPETMFGDVAIAVHPDDDRYRALIGKLVKNPANGIEIPIIADSYVERDKGSGAVKITPAHDANDYEVVSRYNAAAQEPLGQPSILDKHAKLLNSPLVPPAYQGLERFAARKQLLQDLTEKGLVEATESIQHAVPHNSRGGVVLEPMLSDQWYLDVSSMAASALAAASDQPVPAGADPDLHTQLIPKQWLNNFRPWLQEIQPWCISRQLWWGHQIPIWYGPDGHAFTALDAQAAAVQASAHYGKVVELTQDPDVLDTWFSSALWPFSTLDWQLDATDAKGQNPFASRYYPTDLMITGFDILFFWVARMMMMGLKFTDKVPFRQVYLTPLVRDATGMKMSKSKGNVIDPLDVIDEFGADALRFTLAALSSQGRDIKLSEQRIEGYRNFMTKLWNAARFSDMNGCWGQGGAIVSPSDAPTDLQLEISHWLLAKLQSCATAVGDALNAYRFDWAADALYHFVWNDLCDWYLEFAKQWLQSDQADDQAAKQETQAVTRFVLATTLRLLEPIAPFITQDLWQQLSGSGDLLCQQLWPSLDGIAVNQELADVATMLFTITARAREKIAADKLGKDEIFVLAFPQSQVDAKQLTVHDHFAAYRPTLSRLAAWMGGSHASTTHDGLGYVVVSMNCNQTERDAQISPENRAKIIASLQRDQALYSTRLQKLERELGNEQFRLNAPEEFAKKSAELQEVQLVLGAVAQELQTLGAPAA